MLLYIQIGDPLQLAPTLSCSCCSCHTLATSWSIISIFCSCSIFLLLNSIKNILCPENEGIFDHSSLAFLPVLLSFQHHPNFIFLFLCNIKFRMYHFCKIHESIEEHFGCWVKQSSGRKLLLNNCNCLFKFWACRRCFKEHPLINWCYSWRRGGGSGLWGRLLKTHPGAKVTRPARQNLLVTLAGCKASGRV